MMKFGGTSVGSAERIRAAAAISAEQRRQRPVAIVVSAMSKMTDLLLETLRRAEACDKAGVESDIEKLRKRHVETCHELLPAGGRERVLAAHGLASLRSSSGSRTASACWARRRRVRWTKRWRSASGCRLLLMAAYLEAEGTRAVAVNAAAVIVYGRGVRKRDADDGADARARPGRSCCRCWKRACCPVVTGFNGATVDGRPTTLGRGGSDFSASILAAALDAAELWIWTDVDGIMTADPRLVPDCAVLEEVTYREAAELAYNGAKVLHPRTLAPLVEKQIPVWSKNSFAPEKPGTKIVPRIERSCGARAVTSMANVALISIEPANGVLNGTQMMGRALDGLGRANIEVLALSSSSYRQSFCFLVRDRGTAGGHREPGGEPGAGTGARISAAAAK